ncbi:MAG: KpsF/GutQ family sugar-phosphate isomerase [Gammaproteobacteria bacterium]|nr:KpsF/GutQ family sugar-phosphate isomerase [Gammaproteobacteria bacterium]
MRSSNDDLLKLGQKVLQEEAEALNHLCQQLGTPFIDACHLILACHGRVVVTGMGKSGHIGGKIAATLASTGTPAFFVHPGEASHGDLGMITGQDLVLALSNSGETDELITILPLIKRLGVPLIVMSSRPTSRLATAASVHIHIDIKGEACPLGLAPTTSTTATLAMGDALAVALLEARNFSEEDFARSHPAGSLGRRLLLRIEDLMHRDDATPITHSSAMLSDALLEISAKGLGMTTVIDSEGRLQAVFTDGDLRRLLDHGEVNIQRLPLSEVMIRNCTAIRPEQLAADALQLMEERRINALPVVDGENRVIGAINMHDLLQAGVV